MLTLQRQLLLPLEVASLPLLFLQLPLLLVLLTLQRLLLLPLEVCPLPLLLLQLPLLVELLPLHRLLLTLCLRWQPPHLVRPRRIRPSVVRPGRRYEPLRLPGPPLLP
uniref:hypothetical protein n=1 Tax=Cupriavidus plantarum TaxID=942865 RepID=UPI00339D5374